MDQELNVAVGERMCKAFGWESTRALAAFSICEQVKASNALLSTQRQGEHYQQLDKIRSIWVPALSPQDRQGAETARLTGMNPNQRGLASGSRISHERQDDIVQGIVNPFTFSATLKIIRRSDEMLETMTKIGGWWEVNTTPVAQADRNMLRVKVESSAVKIDSKKRKTQGTYVLKLKRLLTRYVF